MGDSGVGEVGEVLAALRVDLEGGNFAGVVATLADGSDGRT